MTKGDPLIQVNGAMVTCVCQVVLWKWLHMPQLDPCSNIS